jgi:hypothetical protein
MKVKRAAGTTPALMEEQTAAAFAEKVTKCRGILPPHLTNRGLREGVRLPDPDLEIPRRHGDIRISDEVHNKYGPHPAGDWIPYVACFCRMNKSLWHECQV